MVTLETMRDNYNWKEALQVAGAPQPALGYAGSLDVFGWDDMAEVVAAAEGENDGASWIAAFRLKDGRFAFLSAWCDYTGWGCQDGGEILLADSLDALVRWALTEENRARLGLSLLGRG